MKSKRQAVRRAEKKGCAIQGHDWLGSPESLRLVKKFARNYLRKSRSDKRLAKSGFRRTSMRDGRFGQAHATRC
jgi:hypothetical protein